MNVNEQINEALALSSNPVHKLQMGRLADKLITAIDALERIRNAPKPIFHIGFGLGGVTSYEKQEAEKALKDLSIDRDFVKFLQDYADYYTKNSETVGSIKQPLKLDGLSLADGIEGADRIMDKAALMLSRVMEMTQGGKGSLDMELTFDGKTVPCGIFPITKSAIRVLVDGSHLFEIEGRRIRHLSDKPLSFSETEVVIDAILQKMGVANRVSDDVYQQQLGAIRQKIGVVNQVFNDQKDQASISERTTEAHNKLSSMDGSMRLIALAKSRGISVEYETTSGRGEGFYSSPLGFGGYRVGPCPSREIAFQQALEKVALIKPGVTELTSNEFSEVYKANTRMADGTLGTSTRRSRIEIRRMDDHYELFIVERLYKSGEEPRDIWQTRHGYGDAAYRYTSLDEAKKEMSKYISDYKVTESEERAHAEAEHWVSDDEEVKGSLRP